MTSEELAIVLTARFDQVDKALDHVTNRLEDYAEEAEDAGKKAEEGFNAAALAIAAAAGGMIHFLEQATALAARSETLNIVLSNMAGTVGKTDSEIQSYVERMKSLGISTLESQQSVLRFMQANLDLEDSLKLARAAQDLAVISGQNSSQAFGMMTQAIVSQNTQLLQNFGIMDGVDKIFKAHAATLGKSTKALTEHEKRQAIINRLLQAGAVAAGNYEAAMDTAGKKVGSLARLQEDAAISIGNTFLPVYNAVVTAVFESLKWFNSANGFIKTMVSLVLGLTAAYVGLVAIVRVFLALKLAANIAMVNATLLATPWILWAAAGAAAIAATLILLDKMDKKIAHTNAQMVSFNRAVQDAKGITFAGVMTETDPVKQLDMATKLFNKNKEILENGKGINADIRTRLQLQNVDLLNRIKELEASRKIRDARKKDAQDTYRIELAAARIRFDFVLKGIEHEIAKIEERRQKAVAEANQTISNERVKAQIIMEINQTADLAILQNKAGFYDMDLVEQLNYLNELKADYEEYAKNRIAIDREIAATEQKLTKQSTAAQKALIEDFAGFFASQFANSVDLFHSKAIDMGKIFEDTINHMVQTLIQSGILSMIGGLFGIPGMGNLFGKGGFMGLGFDDPANDAMARSTGQSKWFSDFMQNYSKGYVDQALLSGRTASVSPAAAAPSTSVMAVYSPTFGMGTPAEVRRAMAQLSSQIKKEGF